MAKCHHTILDVLTPNSIPTENSRDHIIQLTSVAFGLDLRLYPECDEVLCWETKHFQLQLYLALPYSKKRLGDLVFFPDWKSKWWLLKEPRRFSNLNKVVFFKILE